MANALFNSNVAGVPAVACSATAISGPGSNAIYGIANSAADSAIYGEHANTGIGIFGRGGQSGGEGVFGQTNTTSSGVFGDCTADGNGVSGQSSKGTGVYGRSNLDGTVDTLGNRASLGGIGVWGENNLINGFGVVGTAYGVNGVGVEGRGAYFGVSGNGGIGVYGTTGSGTAVWANSVSGVGVLVTSGGDSNAPQLYIQQTTQGAARIRLEPMQSYWWDIAATQVLTFYAQETRQNVLVMSSTGDVTISGTLQQQSSRDTKDSIVALGVLEARQALDLLNPVKFTYKADPDKKLHLGFVAEDLPELLASHDRKTVSSMDIVAVLTAIVRGQHKAIGALQEQVAKLETQTNLMEMTK